MQLPEEYTRGLYQAGRLSYCYLIDDGDNGVILIDTGMPDNTDMIGIVLNGMGRGWRDIRHILLTHADPDHVGSLGQLVEKTGAEVHASEATAEHLRNHTIPQHLSPPIQLIRGLQTKFQNLSEADNVLQGYETLPLAGGIRVIPTPGHTADHVCYFWERERVLFAGDLIGNIDGQPGLSPDAVTQDKEALRQSVLRVLDLKPRLICPAHGEVFRVEDNSLQTLLDKMG